MLPSSLYRCIGESPGQRVIFKNLKHARSHFRSVASACKKPGITVINLFWNSADGSWHTRQPASHDFKYDVCERVRICSMYKYVRCPVKTRQVLRRRYKGI